MNSHLPLAPKWAGEPQLPAEIQQIVNVPRPDRSVQQARQLADYFFNLDPEYKRLEATARMAAQQAQQYRLTGVQDLAWALINTPAFLFNR